MVRFKNIGPYIRNLRSNDDTETRLWPAQMIFELSEEDADKFNREIFAGMRTAFPPGHKRAGRALRPWCVRLDENDAAFVLGPDGETEIPFNARLHTPAPIKLGTPRKPEPKK
jgi:hypothetical protein